MKKNIISGGTIYSEERFWNNQICNDIIEDLESMDIFPKELSNNNTDYILEKNLVSRNQHRIIYESKELADEIWLKLVTIPDFRINIELASSINPSFRFYKYYPSQNFVVHTDAPVVINKNQRSFHSLLIYLNDNYEGGSTKFDGFESIPIQGKIIFFNHTLKHSGAKILSGVKYILRTDIISTGCKELQNILT